jgi:hypothetical protein
MQHKNVTFTSPITSIGPWSLLLITCFLMFLVFAFDALLPLGIAVPILYVAPLACLTLWSSSKDSHVVITAACICTGLIVTGFFLSPPRLRSLSIVNYAMTLGVMWVMTVLSVLRKKVEREVNLLRALLPICSYCKNIRNDKGSWQHIEAYIAAQNRVDLTYGMCPHCAAKEFPEVFIEKGTRSRLAY